MILKKRQSGITPAGFTKPTGYWGPYTAKKASELGLCDYGPAATTTGTTQSVPVAAAPVTTPTLCLSKVIEPGVRNNSDVVQIQKFLIDQGYKDVQASGFFGPATQNAISAFQAKYRSEILDPAGFKNPTGMWGPATAKKASSLGLCTFAN